jgi:micrococcal nuclease
MRKKLLILVLILMASSYAFAENTVNWKDAANHYGKYKTVEGTIVSGKCLPKVCFLNFDQNYRTTFTAVIFSSDLSKFPPNPDQFYLNKKVQVTGTIKEYKGKPEIIIKGPDQIIIVK